MTSDHSQNGSEQRRLHSVTNPVPEASQSHEPIEPGVSREDQLAILSPFPSEYHWFLDHRFGLTTGQPLSPDEVGELFGMTHEEARSFEAEALASVRQPQDTTE